MLLSAAAARVDAHTFGANPSYTRQLLSGLMAHVGQPTASSDWPIARAERTSSASDGRPSVPTPPWPYRTPNRLVSSVDMLLSAAAARVDAHTFGANPSYTRQLPGIGPDRDRGEPEAGRQHARPDAADETAVGPLQVPGGEPPCLLGRHAAQRRRRPGRRPHLRGEPELHPSRIVRS
jgi:hypothetical protein